MKAEQKWRTLYNERIMTELFFVFWLENIEPSSLHTEYNQKMKTKIKRDKSTKKGNKSFYIDSEKPGSKKKVRKIFTRQKS